MFLIGRFQKIHHKTDGLLSRQQFEFMGILKVHQQVAYVIGCFNQPYQRIADILKRLSGF